MHLYIFATIFAVLSSAASAELQCDRQLLSEMATEIISNRQNLIKIKKIGISHFGGDAAYLMLRSGRMNEIQLVNAMGDGRKPRGFDSLLMAHRIATLGPGNVEKWGDDPRDILISADASVERAILLLDQGETYFDIVSQIQADPNYAETFNTHWFGGFNLHRLVTDQTAEVLEQIAKRAELDGYLEAVAPLYAMMPQGNYEEFWERVKDTDFEPKMSRISPSAMRNLGIFSQRRNRPLFSDVEQNSSIPNLYHLWLTIKALTFGPGGDILGISLNQSGLELEIALVSSLFIAAVDTGKIDPNRRPEEAWHFLLSEMTYVLGSQVAEKILATFSIYDTMHYSGTALDMLQIATAIEASKEWLRGETAEIPKKPFGLTEGFDWTRALAVWSVVKTGERFPVEVLTKKMLTLAIEGHIQREEFDKALDMAERANGLIGRLKIARDIMHRQNRLCDQHGLQRISSDRNLLYDFE